MLFMDLMLSIRERRTVMSWHIHPRGGVTQIAAGRQEHGCIDQKFET